MQTAPTLIVQGATPELREFAADVITRLMAIDLNEAGADLTSPEAVRIALTGGRYEPYLIDRFADQAVHLAPSIDARMQS